MPAAVDPRQRELIAAAWTVGTLANLLGCEQVASLTFFETVGARAFSPGQSCRPPALARNRAKFIQSIMFPRISRRNQVARRGPKRPFCLALFLCEASEDCLGGKLAIGDQPTAVPGAPRRYFGRGETAGPQRVRPGRQPADLTAGCFRGFYPSPWSAALRGGVRAILHSDVSGCRIPLHVGTHFDLCFLSRPKS